MFKFFKKFFSADEFTKGFLKAMEQLRIGKVPVEIKGNDQYNLGVREAKSRQNPNTDLMHWTKF